MGVYLRWGVNIWQFCVGLGIGYRGLGVFLGWVLTFIWLMEWICIHQHCNLCSILGFYQWLLSLFLEFCLMLFILVLLIEYLIFLLEVIIFYFPFCIWFCLICHIFGFCCYICFFLSSSGISRFSSLPCLCVWCWCCFASLFFWSLLPLCFDSGIFTNKAKKFLECKGGWNKVSHLF